MNYGEIKHNLISLGFAEESDYDEFEELGYTYDSINRAIQIIESYFPYKAKYEFDIDEDDTGILYIDMSEQDGFLSLADTPVLFEKDGEELYRKFSEYEIENDHTIVMKADDYSGSFRIYYTKLCTPLTKDTPDTFVPEIPQAVHHLIPLLAAYYLWLDDDERKAIQYKNDFDEALGVALQRISKTTASVKPSKWGDI